MICELVGPMGVGKTTVTPLVAERLGATSYRGQAYHGLDDEPLSTTELWVDRIISVARNPRLALAAARAFPGSRRQAVNFALNTCRRDRLEARAARSGGGVIESGPVHAISQMSAWQHHDMSVLAGYIHKADVYVRLEATPEEVTRRLDSRRQLPPEYIDLHDQWIERYDACVDEMIARLGRPLVVVDANDEPGVVADHIVSALTPFVE